MPVPLTVRFGRPRSLVPRPWLHLMRFHGVLAPNAKLRARVVPQGPDVGAESNPWTNLLMVRRGLVHRRSAGQRRPQGRTVPHISAPDELADTDVTHRLPGPLTMFSRRGWLVLLCDLLLLHVGFGVQAVDLKKIPFDS